MENELLNEEDGDDIGIAPKEEDKAVTAEVETQTDKIKIIHIKAGTTTRETVAVIGILSFYSQIQTETELNTEEVKEPNEQISEDKSASLAAFLDVAVNTITREMKQSAELNLIFASIGNFVISSRYEQGEL